MTANDTEPNITEPPKVFISYRFRDSSDVVTAIDRALREDLTSHNVFRDSRTLNPGDEYEDRLIEAVRGSDATLVVIGHQWATSPPGDDPPYSVGEPSDWVRREVEAALSPTSTTKPIPVLLNGASIPAKLPATIGALRRRQHVRLSNGIVNGEMDDYQRILAGVWMAKAETVGNALILFSTESPKAKAELSKLLQELEDKELIDIRTISQYACGAVIVKKRHRKRLARRYPSVVAITDDDDDDDAKRTVNLRLETLAAGGSAIAVLAVGGTLAATGSAATSAGAVAHGAGSAWKTFTSSAKLTSSIFGKSVATGAAIAATVVGVVIGTVTIRELTSADPPFALQGNWNVSEFVVDQEGTDGSFQPIPDGPIVFASVDPDCNDSDCRVIVNEGPDFLVGAEVDWQQDGSLDVDFVADEQDTIRRLTQGGVRCSANDADITDAATLSFIARSTDETRDADIEFAVAIDIAAVDPCDAGKVEWVATAERN